MPTILGANSVSGGYEISNSLRFNDGDSSQLNSTNVGTVTLGTKFTYSVWLKKTAIVTANQNILSADSGTNRAAINFRSGSNDAIRFLESPDAFSSFDSILTTDALFRDPSAWYHIVVAYDSTDGTAANRVKIYSNGVLQTLTGTTANENYTTPFNEASYNLDIGHSRGSNFFDGYMSDANFIDGQTLAPTDFGEFNDNGVWIPKAYEGTYGLNGFFLEFKETGTGTDASGMGADTSGNDHHWAVTNLAATDVTTDTPTNNFATLNPLQITNSDITLSEGNLKHTIVNNWKYTPANMAATNGKWYAEVKAEDASNFLVGFMALGGDSDKTSVMNTNNTTLGNAADGWSMLSPSYSDTAYKNNNTGSVAISGTHIANNDIVILAMDLDNQKIYFGRNGTWNNSGNPATETNPAFTNLTAGIFYTFASSGENSTNNWNFGNPLYTISSGNADANGYGNFEYAVPSGYYSLCTKNLAEFG